MRFFTWAKSLFHRRDTRAIFRYFDGTKQRGIDPIAAFRSLVAHPDYDPESTPLLVGAGDAAAYATMLKAARQVFGVTAWSEDGGGLTETETIELLISFGAYLNSLKKSGNPSLTSHETGNATCRGGHEWCGGCGWW